jgi:hypothetical protein
MAVNSARENYSSHGGEYEDSIALVMKAANTFESSVNFYHTTRRNNPDDSHHSAHLQV